MSGSWSSLPDIPTPREFLAATQDSQGRPLAIGGADPNLNPLGTVERFVVPQPPTAPSGLSLTIQ